MVTVTQVQNLEVDKLKEWFVSLQSQIQGIKKNLQPKEPTKLVSCADVADIFGVSTVTIGNWTKKGLLKSYKLGNRVFYKRHEVETALTEIKTPTTNG